MLVTIFDVGDITWSYVIRLGLSTIHIKVLTNDAQSVANICHQNLTALREPDAVLIRFNFFNFKKSIVSWLSLNCDGKIFKISIRISYSSFIKCSKFAFFNGNSLFRDPLTTRFVRTLRNSTHWLVRGQAVLH